MIETCEMNRDVTLDIVRALCILEIVGFWHLLNYVDPLQVNGSIMTYGDRVTIGVLSTFTFLSGFFLKKYKIESICDALSFYLKRFKRFWIPFFISSLSLHIASLAVHQPWYVDNWHFAASLLGLSVFTVPTPSTLWYMGMIMFFYVLTPIVLCAKKKLNKVILSVLLYIVMGFLIIYFHLDRRTIYYMPMYLLGLILPSDCVSYIKANKEVSLLLSFFFLLLAMIIKANTARLVIILLIVPIALISLSSFLSDSKIVVNCLSIISYASMSMYLFHRQLFLCSVFLYNINSSGSISNLTMPIWSLVFFVLPIIVLFSFCFQRAYDYALKLCEKKRSI